MLNHDQIAGWVWNASERNIPVSLDVMDSGRVLDVITANVLRSDLEAAGKGNGAHAFAIPLNPRIKDGLPHSITLGVSGSQFILPGSPRTITVPPGS